MPIYNVQPTYGERHAVAFPGLVADMVNSNIITRLCETVAGIGFGLAVSQGAADKGAILGGSLNGFVGISVRDITLIPMAGQLADTYYKPWNMGVLNFGQIWCANSGANLVANDPVYFNPTTGAMSGAGGAAVPATATFAGTGNGTFTPGGTPTGAGIKAGNWRVQAIQAITNNGVFMIFDPDGNEVGTAVVGTAISTGPLRFTIADGSTDFAVGDTFTIPVAMAGVGPILGARWVDTALSGGLARVNLGIMR